jgi:hypothetical protein
MKIEQLMLFACSHNYPAVCCRPCPRPGGTQVTDFVILDYTNYTYVSYVG